MGKTLANLVSVPLHFNAVKMFGWETLANGWTIAKVFPANISRYMILALVYLLVVKKNQRFKNFK